MFFQNYPVVIKIVIKFDWCYRQNSQSLEGLPILVIEQKAQRNLWIARI